MGRGDIPDGIVEIHVVCPGRQAEGEVSEDLGGGGGVEFGLLVCEAGELAFQSARSVLLMWARAGGVGYGKWIRGVC